MICIRCGKDSRYKDRSGRKCPGCGKLFAFEPAKGDKFSDRAFKSAIDQVSAEGRLRWGVEHLYYEVARRIKTRPVLKTLLFGGVLACGLGFWSGKWSVFVALIAATLVWLLWSRLRSLDGSTIVLSQRDFDAMWKRWLEVHGPPAGLIVRAAQPPKPVARAPDVGDYSFDRAVICDRARTVDLLIANNFHFENNCAVLTMSGYPAHAFETVKKMLLRNPRLQVYALHDASASGCRMPFQLATGRDWFKDRARVIDVGLRPAQAKPVSTLCRPAPGPVSPGPGLSPRDAKWLSRFNLELAAMRPEHILKSLYAAIRTQHGEEDTDSDSTATTTSDYDNRIYDSDDSLSRPFDSIDTDADGDGSG